MTIQETVNEILRTTRDTEVKSALKIVKAEFQREKDKFINDDKAIKIIRGLMSSEEERIGYLNTFVPGKSKEKADAIKYIHIISALLPVMVSNDAIREWIIDNINFSKYSTPMQAIKDVKSYFGVEADNTSIREVIEELTKK